MVRYKTAELRFYGDLVDFIPGRRRIVDRTFDVAPAIKDMIEACGVPHPEVDLVLVDGEPVDWGHAVCDGQRISVFPRFRAFDVSGFSPVHVTPLPEPRFVLDGHLGRLARYLRLLGCDAELPEHADDAALAQLSHRQARALLTRDIELLKRNLIRHGYFVRATDPLLQCVDVVRYFDLAASLAPFTRCMACNGTLRPVTAMEGGADVPDSVRRRHHLFTRCERCARVYWEGSHHARLREIVASVTRMAAQSRPTSR